MAARNRKVSVKLTEAAWDDVIQALAVVIDDPAKFTRLLQFYGASPAAIATALARIERSQLAIIDTIES